MVAWVRETSLSSGKQMLLSGTRPMVITFLSSWYSCEELFWDVRTTKWAGFSMVSTAGCPSPASARRVGRSSDRCAAIVLSSLSDQPPGGGAGVVAIFIGAPQLSWPGIVASPSILGSCWDEEAVGKRRLPQFKQKLSPGRVSAPQLGHLFMGGL